MMYIDISDRDKLITFNLILSTMKNSIKLYKPDVNAPVSITSFSNNVERETEKAWGLRVNVGNYDGRSKTVWFPKSQGDVFKKTYENDQECLHVSFPEWLLKSNGFLNSYR